jgi:hypothetical protein
MREGNGRVIVFIVDESTEELGERRGSDGITSNAPHPILHCPKNFILDSTPLMLPLSSLSSMFACALEAVYA